jgi:hypothetical protein
MNTLSSAWRIGALVVLVALLASLYPPVARSASRAPIYLPLVGLPLPTTRFGFDLRTAARDESLPLLTSLRPMLVRAGDVNWSDIEAQRGTYDWSHVAGVEANIRRLRAQGIEPVLIINGSPAWAQSERGYICSPPHERYLDDMETFIKAAVRYFAAGGLEVRQWIFWNEAAFRVEQVGTAGGIGCWGTLRAPDYGGERYGRALRRAAAAIRSVQPDAVIIAGAVPFLSFTDDALDGFLRALASIAGGSFDQLGFTAYDDPDNDIRLAPRVARIRSTLRNTALASTPLLVYEIGMGCIATRGCPPDFYQRQAIYASRVYAEALALGVEGVLWYNGSSRNPGFDFSHLIDETDSAVVPRPAYYTLVNVVALIDDGQASSQSFGAALPAADIIQQVQFRRRAGPLTLVWLTRGTPQLAEVAVPAGARVRCSIDLSAPVLVYEDCSDADGNGVISVLVGQMARAVEVLP